MQEISLLDFKIKRPTKVSWKLPNTFDSTTDPLSFVRSKSLRQFLRHADTALSKKGIIWEHIPVSAQKYREWLEYYQRKMTEKNFSIIAKPEWYAKKIEEQKKVEGLFFYKENKMIGSSILVIEENKANMAYRASDSIEFGEKNASLGAIIYFFFIREMIKRKMKTIVAGKSRNAFGVFNTIGYLEHKTRFNYIAHPVETEETVETVPVQEDGSVLFYGLQEDEVTLYFLKPKGSDLSYDPKRFSAGNIPYKILEY